MKMERKQGILVNARLPKAGVTIYTKKGRTIIRTAISNQPKRCTLSQFNMRERLSHNRRLWHRVRGTGLISYAQFCALAAKLPPLYLTRMEHFEGFTLLLPGIPVACGTLPDVALRLGSVEGSPALLTNLRPELLTGADRFTLVTLHQTSYGDVPQLAVATEVVPWAAFAEVDGCLVLTGAVYGDTACGWALVRHRKGRCSTQTVVTAATAYQAYLTDEAQQRAAASYGGLTG